MHPPQLHDQKTIHKLFYWQKFRSIFPSTYTNFINNFGISAGFNWPCTCFQSSNDTTSLIRTTLFSIQGFWSFSLPLIQYEVTWESVQQKVLLISNLQSIALLTSLINLVRSSHPKSSNLGIDICLIGATLLLAQRKLLWMAVFSDRLHHKRPLENNLKTHASQWIWQNL